MSLISVKALTFDVFGTVVDWRTGVMRELSAFERERRRDDAGIGGVPCERLADDWRRAYYAGIADMREGRRPWATIETVLKDAIASLAPQHGLPALSQDEIARLTGAWSRLEAWDGSAEALCALKADRIIAALSNGNVGLIIRLSRHAGLPWDMVFGPDVLAAYKPSPKAYLTAAELLSLRPDECMMVATHARDLRAARAAGFRTAYVYRRDELGPGVAKEEPDPGTDLVVEDLHQLARALKLTS